MGAEGVVIVSSYLSNDLIRVVTLDATVIASGSLTYLMGCGVNQYNHSTIKRRLKLQKFINVSGP